MKIKGEYKDTYPSYIRYHLKDVIVGKIFFLLVRIKIKYMELCIVRRETTGFGKFNSFILDMKENLLKLTYIIVYYYCSTKYLQ